jgi:Cu-Zn family superoxide dismutase
MSMHRFALALFSASAIAALATMYGCTDNSAEAPPELDAGNPTRRNDSGGTSSSGGTGSDATSDAPPPPTYKAKADIESTGVPDAGTPTGSVDFSETNGVVAVQVSISGATPGPHGMHIHAGTSCGNDADGGIALLSGGHFNPGDAGHGYPDASAHHPGDMGNIVIDGNGDGTLSLAMTGYTVQLDAGPLSVIGRAVVFHQGTDDGTTQPTGNAGARPGCGIINVVPQ